MTQTSKPYVILVGIDYSTASEQAVQRALELAAVHPNAELHAVHVLPAPDTPYLGAIAAAEDGSVPSQDAKAFEELQNHVALSLGAFDKQRNGAASKPIKVVSHLRAHAPAQEIAQLASDLEADLVVVGMCGRSPITRFFLGSVAESVTRLAPCPVLVFRPKGLPVEYPKIEPPCPKCLETRLSSQGKEYWCAQHRQQHGQRHVYHYVNRMSQDQSMPMFLKE